MMTGLQHQSPRTSRHSEATWQLVAAVLAFVLYFVCLLALKWWIYPGWTWRGYLTDLKALVGLSLFAAGFAAWLVRLYRIKTPEEVARDYLRNSLQSSALRPIVVVIGLAAAVSTPIVLGIGEREVAPILLADIEQSNWKHAREELTRISSQPLRPDLLE